MRRYSSRNGLQTLTELNITPLLDLAFVLLIIFMITTPLIENSLDLVVPKSSTAKGSANPAETLTISLDKNETLKIDNRIVSPAELEAELIDWKARQPEGSVVFRPHHALEIQKFITVMDVLQRVGLTKVGVMTHKEDSTPDR